MRNHLENRFRGYVLLSIKSEKIQRFFHLCAFRGLTLWNVECAAQDYKACVSTVDFKKRQPICRKTNTRVHILRKFG
ncbi:MAG: sporulation protein YqfD, partial [Blautia sp.]